MAAEEERRSWEERGQKNENQKTRGRKMENEETRGREKENEEERQSRLRASLSEVEDLSSYFRKPLIDVFRLRCQSGGLII